VKTTTLAALAALAVTGCATPGTPHITVPYSGRVTWVIHPGPTSLGAAYREGGGHVSPERHLMGFATWRGLLESGGVCEIHTMFPGAYDSLAELGSVFDHEIRHCRKGRWHD